MDIDYKALGIKEEDYLSLLKQCQEEVNLSYDFMLPKWESWGKRLKLLNNQRKDETTIGDTTAHVHFNTIHAALYDDEINTTFLPRSQGDEVQTQNLNPLYEYDCEIMEKEKLNYKWIWNTLFFSRSLVGMFEFDREMMVPKPTLDQYDDVVQGSKCFECEWGFERTWGDAVWWVSDIVYAARIGDGRDLC